MYGAWFNSSGGVLETSISGRADPISTQLNKTESGCGPFYEVILDGTSHNATLTLHAADGEPGAEKPPQLGIIGAVYVSFANPKM